MVAAASIAIASCSSSGGSAPASSGTTTTGGSTTAAADPLGTPNKATGTPITIGYLSEGKAESVDTTGEIKGAQAAVGYVNDYLGGIAGHPITLKVCEAMLSPAKATDCSQQMVSANVAAVAEGSFGETDSSIDVLSPAKIPVIIAAASTQKSLTTPGVFVLTNSLSYFGTPIADAAKAGVKKLDLMVINVPAAAGPAEQLGPLLGANAGVAVKVVAVPTGTADMSPQVAAALKDKPDGFFMLGDPTFCTSALKAIKTLAPTLKVWGIDRCIGPEGGASIPGGYEGVRIVSAAALDTTTPDGKIYAAAIEKYGNGAKVEAQSGVGYTALLGMATALNAAKITDVTPAGITAAMKAMPASPLPLSAGGTFQCDGKQIALAPNVCAAGGIISTADKDGKLATYEAVPANPDLYKLPKS